MQVSYVDAHGLTVALQTLFDFAQTTTRTVQRF